MSRENVEVVRRVFEAAARGDTGGVMALYDPDIVWDASRTERGTMTGHLVRGRESLLAWLREWYAAWETVDDDLEDLIDAGDDGVVSIMVQRGRGKASGVEVQDRLGTVWTVRGGRVVRAVWFPSAQEALEEVGLSDVSRQNVALARRVLDAVARRDLSSLLELANDGVEWRSFFAVGEADGEYHGTEGLRKYVTDLSEAWEVLEPTIESALHVGRLVVAVGRIRYQGKGSGVQSESPAGWVFKFRDGKVVLFRAFREPEEALEAVGRE